MALIARPQYWIFFATKVRKLNQFDNDKSFEAWIQTYKKNSD